MHAADASRSTRRPRRGGVTLLDVVLTVAIVGIMAGIALPRYGHSLARYRAEMAARRIVNDLDLLRMRARAQGTDETGYFHAETDSCRFISGPDLDDATKEYWTYLADEPYRADIVESNFDADGKIYMRYGNYGHPYWGGYVTVKVGDIEKKIVVDPSTGEAAIR